MIVSFIPSFNPVIATGSKVANSIKTLASSKFIKIVNTCQLRVYI